MVGGMVARMARGEEVAGLDELPIFRLSDHRPSPAIPR